MIDKDKHAGTLYLVSTPIGNLKDITFRAVEVLKSVSLIAAEDTRHSRKLFSAYDIKTPFTSYHSYNKQKRSKALIDRLKKGGDIALITDSGTPCISDPGTHLVREVLREDIEVTAIPGATAFVAALVISGMDTSRFVFEGFLSNKTSQRKKRLKELAMEARTVIIYESPHRLLKTLEDIHEIYGDRPIACLRELTKKFEESNRQNAGDLVEHFTRHKPRGEFVIVI